MIIKHENWILAEILEKNGEELIRMVHFERVF